MRAVFGRPVLLVSLGLVLVLTGIWVALNGIGAHRIGTAVEDARLCAASDAEPCLEEVDVRVNGPVFTRRAAGDDFTVRTIDGDYLGRVTVDGEGSALLGATNRGTVTAWLDNGDDDIVAVALEDGAVVPALWTGLRAVTAYLTFGLFAVGVGVTLLVTGLRFRRAGTSWTTADERTPFGTAAAALLVVPAFVSTMALRAGAPPVAMLAMLGVALLLLAGGLVVTAASRRD